jgi:prophage DNA circulation protein
VSAVTDDFAAASVTLATALAESTTDPADAVRLLLPLCQFEPAPVFGGGPLAYIISQWQYYLAANMRAAAISALAQACAAYQPISYQDAQSLRLMVCAQIGAEATIAADAGNDALYQALSNLRIAVAIDLAWRGANLPMLVEVTTPASMPSLTEAWNLYQDTSREPALVASADPPHPLFMPLSFPALSR